jgi:hypothetical protein
MKQSTGPRRELQEEKEAGWVWWVVHITLAPREAGIRNIVVGGLAGTKSS